MRGSKTFCQRGSNFALISTRQFMILNRTVSLIFVLLDSIDFHWRASSIDDTLLVFLKRLETYLAVLRWISRYFVLALSVGVPLGCTVFQTGPDHADIGICLGFDAGGL